MKTKGLSFDQKKDVLLNALLAEASIFNMQELESLAKKNKVIPQAVKEVVEALLAERTMCMEKIGTQNIYWAFASQRKSALLAEHQQLQLQVKDAEIKNSEAKRCMIQAQQAVKMTNAERDRFFQDIEEFKIKAEKLKSELAQLERNDPRKTKAKIDELKSSKKLCDIWTDNIFVLKKAFVTRFKCQETALDERFDIPEDLDYI